MFFTTIAAGMVAVTTAALTGACGAAVRSENGRVGNRRPVVLDETTGAIKPDTSGHPDGACYDVFSAKSADNKLGEACVVFRREADGKMSVETRLNPSPTDKHQYYIEASAVANGDVRARSRRGSKQVSKAGYNVDTSDTFTCGTPPGSVRGVGKFYYIEGATGHDYKIDTGNALCSPGSLS